MVLKDEAEGEEGEWGTAVMLAGSSSVLGRNLEPRGLGLAEVGGCTCSGIDGNGES